MQYQLLSFTAATSSSSLLSSGQTMPASPVLSQVPFCLFAQSSEKQGCWQAEVKWCACWAAICEGEGGTRWQAAGWIEKDSSPVCHISPPQLIPATVSWDNNLLPQRAGEENLVCLLKQKVIWYTRGAGAQTSSTLASSLTICAQKMNEKQTSAWFLNDSYTKVGTISHVLYNLLKIVVSYWK